MSHWVLDEDEFERQYVTGVAAEKAAAAVEPRAELVAFDSETETLSIRFRQGYTVLVPRRLMPELAHLPASELAQVSIVAAGEGLEWPHADLHISVPGLLWRLVGSPGIARQVVAEHARRAAAVRSPARAEASRKNGAKGGRPRKQIAESPPSTNIRRKELP